MNSNDLVAKIETILEDCLQSHVTEWQKIYSYLDELLVALKEENDDLLANPKDYGTGHVRLARECGAIYYHLANLVFNFKPRTPKDFGPLQDWVFGYHSYRYTHTKCLLNVFLTDIGGEG
jgi:hypothetical protein